MQYSTFPTEANNPLPCWSMPSIDSPALEQSAADADRQRTMQRIQDNLADAAFIAQMEAIDVQQQPALSAPAPAPEKFIRCKCGVEKCGSFWLISPRTDRKAVVWTMHAHLLTSNTRAKIRFGHTVGSAMFTTAELSKIFEVVKLQEFVAAAPPVPQFNFQAKRRR